jgi:hypothetical protein
MSHNKYDHVVKGGQDHDSDDVIGSAIIFCVVAAVGLISIVLYYLITIKGSIV